MPVFEVIKGARRGMELLELELQPVVNHPGGAGKEWGLQEQPLLFVLEPALRCFETLLHACFTLSAVYAFKVYW